MLRLIIIFIFALFQFSSYSQTWTHDFETAGGYTTSDAECTDGSDDYFIRTDGSNTNDDPTSPQGSFYFAAQDIDAAGCPAIAGANGTLDFDDIDISNCTGLSLEILAATFNTSKWDNVDYVHILYDIDNSGTWSNLIWFENNGATYNTVAQVDTDFNGVGDGLILSPTFQNIIGSIAGSGALIDIRIEFQLNAGSEDINLDNIRIFGTGCGAPSSSILTGVITGNPFTVDCAGTADTGTIDFTSTGTFIGGNIYTAQLSDAAGSFASPTSIGTLASTANSGTINITIPAGTASGSGYLIRVISDNPVTTGSSSAVFTITQTGTCGPTLPAGLIINEWSNGPAGSQEYYEFVVAGQCGELVDIRGYILDDNNGTFTTPASYSGTASGIAPGHFRFAFVAQWASIPVGSLILIYNANDPNTDLPADDPTDANNDSLYVVPHNNALFERCLSMPIATTPDSLYTPCTYTVSPLSGWGALSLRNSGDAIQVRQPDGTYYQGVSYGGSEISGGPNNLKLFTGSGSAMAGWFSNGDFFDISNWTSGAANVTNQTPGLTNNALNQAWLLEMRDSQTENCPFTILPVEISLFEGWNEPYGNKIIWETATEKNSDYFVIDRSIDGKSWIEVQTIKSVGNSETTSKYSTVDIGFEEVMNYYRLSQYDLDGTEKRHYKSVTIDNSIVSDIELIGIYNILGQPVTYEYKGLQIHVFSNGTSKKVLH